MRLALQTSRLSNMLLVGPWLIQCGAGLGAVQRQTLCLLCLLLHYDYLGFGVRRFFFPFSTGFMLIAGWREPTERRVSHRVRRFEDVWC